MPKSDFVAFDFWCPVSIFLRKTMGYLWKAQLKVVRVVLIIQVWEVLKVFWLPQVEIVPNIFMPKLSVLFSPSSPCPFSTSPSLTSPSSAPQQNCLYSCHFQQQYVCPIAALQKYSLMSLIHLWRTSLHLSTSISTSILNWTSRHFLKTFDSSCPFLRNQVLGAIWTGKGRYPETRSNGKCWFPGYSGVISKHDGKTEDWVLPMLLSLVLVTINRDPENYS